MLLVIRNGRLWRARRVDRAGLLFVLGVASALSLAGLSFWKMEQSRRRVEGLEQRVWENHQLLARLRERVTAARTTASAQVPTPEAIRQSLRTFEHVYLPDADVGLSRVLGQVNRIAQESGVVLSSDLMFNPLEEAEYRAGGGASVRSGGRGFYPGLRIAFTVSGQYANVKQFLAQLERSPLLLIVESLTLKSVEERAAPRPTAAAASAISLEITLSAYFRRTGPPPAPIGKGAL